MESLAAITEVIAWVALPIALVVGIAVLLIGVARGRWEEVPAEVVDGEVRWFSTDGRMHSAPAEGAADHEELVVHYRAGRPERWYPQPVAHDERAARFTAITLGAVGTASAVVSTIASFA